MSRRLAGAFLQYGSRHWGSPCGVWLRTLVRQDAAASRSCVCEDNNRRRLLRGQDRGGSGGPKRFELLGLLRPWFVRPQPWLQAGKYLGALVSDLPKRNCQQIARRGGDPTARPAQRLPAAWPVRRRPPWGTPGGR